MPGPRPTGDVALSPAERQRAYRARLKAAADAKPVVVRYRRSADRHTRPKRGADAVVTLLDCPDAYQDWRDGLPASLTDGDLADRLDAVLDLRELVDQLDGAKLPKGFGRDVPAPMPCRPNGIRPSRSLARRSRRQRRGGRMPRNRPASGLVRLRKALRRCGRQVLPGGRRACWRGSGRRGGGNMEAPGGWHA
jgi:hypothetical protein